MSKAQIGTFEDLLEITEEALRPVVTALREVVFAGYVRGGAPRG